MTSRSWLLLLSAAVASLPACGKPSGCPGGWCGTVVIAAADGYRVQQRPVKLYPRRAGKSKFGIGRIPVGVFDLLSVWFQLRFGRKPMLFFGLWGAFPLPAGFLVAIVAFVLRFGLDLGFRPRL